MKIGYLISTLRRCGPVNQLYYMIKHLDRTKYTPVIITLSQETENSCIGKFKDLNIEIITINLSRIKGIFTLNSLIAKIVSDNKIDIVHSQGVRADGINAKLKHIPHKVCSIRNYAYEDYTMKFGLFTGNIMALQHLGYIKKITHRASCSRFIAEMLLTKHSIQTDVIEDGIDTDTYKPVPDQIKAELRKKLSIPSGKKLIIFTGSMIKRKDPATLLKGFIRFHKSNKEFMLIMVGNGMLLPELKKDFNDDSIIFTGEISNVNEYLAIADYFVLPSLSEGLPNAALEALSTGLPCVLSDIKPHKVFTDATDYKGAVYFNAGSDTGLSEALAEITKGNAEQAANNNRKMVIDRYSAVGMAEKYTKLYDKITKGT